MAAGISADSGILMRTGMNLLADWLRGCAHRKTTFPMTLQSHTYIVCLECGRRFAYDWTTMRIAGQPAGRDRWGRRFRLPSPPPRPATGHSSATEPRAYVTERRTCVTEPRA